MTVADNKPRPKMRPNYKRILEAIMFLINEAEKRGLYVTEFDIDKSMFIADVDHLNKYGRPVSFDNYVAMKAGPVPSMTRDILQPNFNSKPFYTESWPLWERVPSPADGQRAFKFIHPKRAANTRVLSQTDVNALSEALSVVKSLKFSGTSDHTHKHAAYIAAWKPDGVTKAFDMEYAKLFDVPDDEAVEDLVYSSKHM